MKATETKQQAGQQVMVDKKHHEKLLHCANLAMRYLLDYRDLSSGSEDREAIEGMADELKHFGFEPDPRWHREVVVDEEDFDY